MLQILHIGIAFSVALFIVLAVTPLVRRLVVHKGYLKRPSQRGVHKDPTPHMGGIAIAVGFTVAVLLTGGAASRPVTGLLLGGALMAAVGFWDDLKGLRASVKLALQVLGALLAVWGFGIHINAITNPLGGAPLGTQGPVGDLLTVVWMVALMNIINLADGLDGLAAGLALIASFSLLSVALFHHDLPMALLTAALSGAALGFLRYNFFVKPARIFMGDTGSLYLGYLLGGISVVGTLKETAAISLGVTYLAVLFLALTVPVLDTAFAILRRVVNHQPIGQPDRGHLHHRLVDLGLSDRQTVLLIYFFSLIMGLAGIAAAEVGIWKGMGLIGGLVVLLVLGAKRAGLLDLRQEVSRHPR